MHDCLFNTKDGPMTAKNVNTKQKIAQEIRLFAIYATFLTLFLCSLTTYKRLILGEYSIAYLHYR